MTASPSRGTHNTASTHPVRAQARPVADDDDREQQLDAVDAVREVAHEQRARRADEEERGLHVAAEPRVALRGVEAEVARGGGQLMCVCVRVEGSGFGSDGWDAAPGARV